MGPIAQETFALKAIQKNLQTMGKKTWRKGDSMV